MPSQQIYTLPAVGTDNSEPEALRDQIERALIGTEEPTIPGDTEEDKKWAYKRSVPTLVLYDEAGLRLYDQITANAPEYYPFEDELNLFKKHGAEIAVAMGFPGPGGEATSVPSGDKKHKDKGYRYPPQKPWKPARWGDADVGRWNLGVNGEEGLASGLERGWDVVELGAGALRKTAHFLTALADTLPDSTKDGNAPPPIAYHALDLSRPELERVLGEMDEAYGASLNGRVSAVGLHGDYFAGLELIRDGGLHQMSSLDLTPMPSTPDTTASDTPASPESIVITTPAIENCNLPNLPDVADHDIPDLPSLGTSIPSTSKWSRPDVATCVPDAPIETIQESGDRPLHIIFLGSSLGNFERESAAPFLRSLPLKPGDTLLIGLDGRPAPGPEGKHKVEVAYNDPSGHTRAFEEHGWDVARKELGLEPDDGVEFVGRYNEVLGRHEAYYRSKREQTIPLPSGKRVTLKEGELLNIEWSYKYSMAEALDLFDEADLHVLDSWKAPDSEYRLWLLERPPVRFNKVMSTGATDAALSLGIPSWSEWEAMWAFWDHITLEMIPPEMLHTKPIDLRHICLFYLGHIPTFLDIFLSRITNGKHSEPVYFKDIFERGIDPDVDDPTKIHAHSEVPSCEEDWPTLSEIITFRDNVRQRLRGIYDDIEAGKGLSRRSARAIFMGYEHEAMHAETLLYMLLQSPMTLHPGPTPKWDVLASHWEEEVKNAGKPGQISVAATTVTLGHDDAEAGDKVDAGNAHEFGWDNEHPKTAFQVTAFKAEALPITNAEYLAFIGGKDKPAPASWVDVDGEWHVRSLYGPVPFSIAGKWPLMASRDEIEAYATSRGGRLPTEPELRALWAHPDGPRPTGPTANIGLKHWHPVPPTVTTTDYAGHVLHGHNGGVWEWTSTKFDGFPGFVPSEMYPGYSADFFDGKHYVVLGGSFASVPRIASRASFRNWYQGNYRFAWVGGRVVYDV